MAPPFSFIVRRPTAPLSLHVDAIWHAKGRIDYDGEHILPTGHAVLLINLGSPIRTVDGKGNDRDQCRAWVCGVHSRAMLNQPRAETHALGVAFRPYGAHAVLGVPLVELADRVVGLEDLWGSAARELREEIGHHEDPQVRIAVAQSWLTRRLVEPGLPRGLAPALELLCGEPPRSVRELSEQLGISHKHLIDRCRRFIGLPPQQIIRVHRLGRALRAIDPQRPADWARLAVEHGYCDQSHLVREFRRLAGLTPGEYVARRLAAYGPSLRKGQDPAFVPNVRG